MARFFSFLTVSYTHLDVYKRQAYQSGGRLKHSSRFCRAVVAKPTFVIAPENLNVPIFKRRVANRAFMVVCSHAVLLMVAVLIVGYFPSQMCIRDSELTARYQSAFQASDASGFETGRRCIACIRKNL